MHFRLTSQSYILDQMFYITFLAEGFILQFRLGFILRFIITISYFLGRRVHRTTYILQHASFTVLGSSHYIKLDNYILYTSCNMQHHVYSIHYIIQCTTYDIQGTFYDIVRQTTCFSQLTTSYIMHTVHIMKYTLHNIQ